MHPLRTILLAGLGTLSLLPVSRAHIVVTSPSNSEGHAPGATMVVSWFELISHGPTQYDVYLSVDAGLNWTLEASVPWPATSVAITVPNAPGADNLIRVDQDGLPSFSNGFFVISDPAVRLTSPFVGQPTSFRVEAPSTPGGTGVIFANLTGNTSFLLPLPGGVSLLLATDAFTTLLLGAPSLSLVPLDGNGDGLSAPLSIPNDPALVGMIWAVATAVLPPGDPLGWPFSAGSITIRPVFS